MNSNEVNLYEYVRIAYEFFLYRELELYMIVN